MVPGTGCTACLSRHCRFAASDAKSECYSFLAVFCRTAAVGFFAFRLLVSGSVVLSAFSDRCPFGTRFFVSGFVFCRGLWAMARFWSGLFGGMAGCLDFSLRSRWSLRGCVVTVAGRFSAACRGFGVASYPWEWKGINKKLPFRWVYPRVYGVPSRASDRSLRLTGIPPRSTGTTISFGVRLNLSQEYPRVHGDNSSTALLRRRVPGIPPRSRGQLYLGVRCCSRVGNTPACTGTTLPEGVTSLRQDGIPPVHGYNSSRASVGLPGLGVPPPVWGQLPHDDNQLLQPEYPACTGTTSPGSMRNGIKAENPRMHGDNVVGQPGVAFSYGKNPHARGQPECL